MSLDETRPAPSGYFTTILGVVAALALGFGAAWIARPPPVDKDDPPSPAKQPQSPSTGAKGHALDRSEAERSYERGAEHVLLRNYSAAIEEFSRALALEPERARWWAARGRTHRAQLEWTRSASDYTQAIRLRPGQAAWHGARGQVYKYQKDYARSAADYTRAIRLEPSEARWHEGRALARRNMADLEGALADFTKAIELGGPGPGSANFFYQRGFTYLMHKKVDPARADLRQALDLLPEGASSRRLEISETLRKINNRFPPSRGE